MSENKPVADMEIGILRISGEGRKELEGLMDNLIRNNFSWFTGQQRDMMKLLVVADGFTASFKVLSGMVDKELVPGLIGASEFMFQNVNRWARAVGVTDAEFKQVYDLLPKMRDDVAEYYVKRMENKLN